MDWAKQIRTSLPCALQQYIAVAAIVVWLGGFSFYAVHVLRVGGHIVGHLEQGYVTQKVTDTLNIIATVMLICVAVDIAVHLRYIAKPVLAIRGLGFVVMLASLCLLFVIHNQLDALLDLETFRKPKYGEFHPHHQNYQMTMTFFWCGCVAELAFMLHGHVHSGSIR